MKLTWLKTGGHDCSSSILYTASAGGLTILRTKVCGTWTMPALYQNDQFVRGFPSVKEAKVAGQELLAHRV